jgi:hypothetical protein
MTLISPTMIAFDSDRTDHVNRIMTLADISGIKRRKPRSAESKRKAATTARKRCPNSATEEELQQV